MVFTIVNLIYIKHNTSLFVYVQIARLGLLVFNFFSFPSEPKVNTKRLKTWQENLLLYIIQSSVTCSKLKKILS